MAEPVVGPMLGLGLLSSLLHPVLPSASAALGWLAGCLAAYLALCARLWTSLPGAQITSGKVLAAAVLLLGVAALALRRTARNTRVAPVEKS
jgi:hypothetical protein